MRAHIQRRLEDRWMTLPSGMRKTIYTAMVRRGLTREQLATDVGLTYWEVISALRLHPNAYAQTRRNLRRILIFLGIAPQKPHIRLKARAVHPQQRSTS